MVYVPPVALVRREGPVMVKRFRSAEECETEARWWRWYPDFCPELVAQDGPDLVTAWHPVAWDTPEWRDAEALARLVRDLHSLGVHHRDVHLKNVVLVDGQPRLIDWYTAVQVPDCPSYDLYGEESGLDKPDLHVDYQCWTTPNRWSIKEAWGVDVPAALD